MKKARKLTSIALVLLMLISVFVVAPITADAAGWLKYARNVQLDSAFSDEFNKSGYWYQNGDIIYMDAFKFTVPAKGKISIRIECEEYYKYYTDLYIYSANDLDNYLWEGYVSSEFSSARGVYYDDLSVTLSAGTYYFVVEENYWGVVDTTFEYNLSYKPTFANTSITSKTAKKKAFKVCWRKASAATGYQIQYSLKSNMKSAKTVTVSKQSTTSKTITKLKAKKKYYVRVRTYKKMKVEGKTKTYYGKWSAKKNVKTK